MYSLIKQSAFIRELYKTAHQAPEPPVAPRALILVQKMLFFYIIPQQLLLACFFLKLQLKFVFFS